MNKTYSLSLPADMRQYLTQRAKGTKLTEGAYIRNLILKDMSNPLPLDEVKKLSFLIEKMKKPSFNDIKLLYEALPKNEELTAKTEINVEPPVVVSQPATTPSTPSNVVKTEEGQQKQKILKERPDLSIEE